MDFNNQRQRSNVSLAIRFVLPIILFLVVLYIGVIGQNPHYMDYVGRVLSNTRLHAPDLNLLSKQPPAVLIHLFAAILAVGLTVFQFVGKKGAALHRIIGWTWVIIMFIVAISSLFIRFVNHGAFSFIHIFTALTLISLPRIVFYARKHNVKAHKSAVYGLVFGGLLIAGLFTFLPGRLMYQLFFG